MEAVVNAPSPLPVRVQGGSHLSVSAGMLSLIPVTCPHLPLSSPGCWLLKPLGPDEGVLLEGLLVSPCLVTVEGGVLHTPLTNVGTTDAMLHLYQVVGTVQWVEVANPDSLSFESTKTSPQYLASLCHHSWQKQELLPP